MTNKFFIFFSEIFGKTVRDNHHRRLGRLWDVGMKLNGEIYPKSAYLILRKGFFRKSFAKCDWEQVSRIDDYIKLKLGRHEIRYEPQKPRSDLSLCADILDQQIVDINNRKVVRVNDLHLLKVENHLYLAHMDVGSRGLVRRLRWTGGVDRIVKLFSPHSSFLHQEDFISWKNAQLLNLGQVKNVLRLDVAGQKLSQLHPTELADIIEDLDKFEKANLFKTLDTFLQRKVFADLATLKQAELIELLEEREAVDLLANIPSDDAADILLKLPQRKTRKLMKLMETKTSKKLSKLIKFSKNSAGGLMTTEYITVGQNALVKDAIQKIKDHANSPGNVYYVYVVDEQNRLLGSTALKHFINADYQQPLLKICPPNNIFVRTDDGVEKVALLFEKYKFSVIPVLNEEDCLQGVIAIDDVLEELISMSWSKYKEKL